MAEACWALFDQEKDKLLREMAEKSGIDNNVGPPLLEYINEIESLPKNLPYDNNDKVFLKFIYLEKPSIDWDRIKACLHEFPMTDIAIEAFIFALTRSPINFVLNPSNNPFIKVINDSRNSIVTEKNQMILKLSPLIALLEKLQKENPQYKDFGPLSATIEKFKYDKALCDAIIKYKENAEKFQNNYYGFDKSSEISMQKHKCWNSVVSFAVDRLNEYCHNDNCDSKCGKTHQKAITKVAELLKILYPTIWTDDIPSIAKRIKQREYRTS